MTHTEKTDWESKYQNKDTQWDKGEPSPGLVDFLLNEKLPDGGTVLVPGCGFGHDVRAWARAGFDTLGLDIAPTAIIRARELTPEGITAQFSKGDFLKNDHPTEYDWLFEHTLFCAIQPEHRADYVRAAARSVRKGGCLLAVHYIIPDEDGPPYGTTREEVCQRFESEFDLLKDWIPRSYSNRTGLERMFYWRKKKNQ